MVQHKVTVDPKLDREFDKAFETLQQLVDFKLVDQMHQRRANAVYTNSVVLWMLTYQRLKPDASLEAAVKQLIDGNPDLLPDNKRVVEGKLSTNSGGYSRARSRLPQAAAQQFATQVSQSLIEATTPSFGQRRVFLIDGTTMTLAPEKQLQQAFPPASNQHGEGVWPVALLVVAHEMASGAALLPQVGAMYGEQAVSETALMAGCMEQMPADSIVMADAGYGIFTVAHTIDQAGQSLLLRMTEARFNALRRQATLVDSGAHWQTYSHTWRPSAKNRQTHPDLPADAVLTVRLHEIVIHDNLTLRLVTTLPDSAVVLADLYKQRNDVEVDIRNVKVVLDTENIRAKSVDMFHKELLTSQVAYNLVTQFRRQAAVLVDERPRRMSFKRTWTTFRQFLLSAMYTAASDWRERYRLALHYAMKDKLPNRPNRSYERETYSKRPKSNQFKKRKRPNS